MAVASLYMSLKPLTVFNGGLLLSSPHESTRSASIFKWRYRIYHDANLTNRRTRSQAFRNLVNPNVTGEPSNQVVMVDPLEAKQLAAKQMDEIKRREKLKRKRQIEAINGAWAMIGLTAGLVIEGHTGKSILAQLAGYLTAIINFFLP